MEPTTVTDGDGTQGPDGRPPRTLVRRVLAIGGWIVALLSAFALALAALVHVDSVSTSMLGWWASWANPYPGTTLSVARIELDWPAHLRVRGLELTPEPGQAARGPEASVGLLDVRLDFRSLLGGRAEILEAGIFDVALVVSQGADSTWDALAPFGGGSDAGAATPFHGYFYRILKAQGPHAPDGAYDYMVGDHMIGGFALLASPATWDNSGVMSFLVNQDGVVYQKDLGPETEKLASEIQSFDPDDSWSRVPEADLAPQPDGVK